MQCFQRNLNKKFEFYLNTETSRSCCKIVSANYPQNDHQTSEIIITILYSKSNQGNQDSSGNHKNEIQGQNQTDNRQTQQKTQSN